MRYYGLCHTSASFPVVEEKNKTTATSTQLSGSFLVKSLREQCLMWGMFTVSVLYIYVFDQSVSVRGGLKI